MVLAPPVRAHDVGVLQRGRGFGFPLEARDQLSVVGGRQDFQGDFASVDHVLGRVDLSHAAGGDALGQPVTTGNELVDHFSVKPSACSSKLNTASVSIYHRPSAIAVMMACWASGERRRAGKAE